MVYCETNFNLKVSAWLLAATIFFGGNITAQEKGTRAATEQFRQSHMDVYGRPPIVNGGQPDRPLTVHVVKNVNAGSTPYKLYVIEPVKVGKKGAIWKQLPSVDKARQYARDHGYTRITWRVAR